VCEVQWKNCNGDVVSPIGSPFVNVELISGTEVNTETSCNLILTTELDQAIDIFNIPSACTITTILTFEGNEFFQFYMLIITSLSTHPKQNFFQKRKRVKEKKKCGKVIFYLLELS
jgi:hypothetical protein